MVYIISHNQSVMENNKAPELEGAEAQIETPSRRDFLQQGAAVVATAVLASAGLARSALADEVTPVAASGSEAEDLPQAAEYRAEDFADIPYRESEMGIDYHALADFPVDHMLSQGEAEWMENAGERYGERASVFWDRFAPLIGEGRVSKSIVEGMKSYTPKMLLSFARLKAGDPKYGLIEAAGRLFQLEQFEQSQKIALNDH